MKTMIRAVTIIVALTCASVIKALAQDEQPPPPKPPPPVAIIHGVQNLAEGTVHMVQNDVEKHVQNAQQMVSKVFQPHIFKIRSGTPRTARSLVIRSSDMAPRAQSELEEDMTIMAHILDKTLAEQFTDEPAGHVAMGINVSFVPGEGPTRNLYLDGYGAVFFLNVNFPLLPPPVEKNVEKQKTPADSTWEEARAEVYGQSAKSWASRPQYDAAKVSALKKAVLASLKNASNIRSVRSDESVTVCVIGAPSRGPARVTTSSGSGGIGASGGGGGGGGFGAFSGSGGSGGGGGGGGEQNVWVTTSGSDDAPANKTTLTIRVKKADCEDFANGKLTADEFRNRATMTIYGEPQS